MLGRECDGLLNGAQRNAPAVGNVGRRQSACVQFADLVNQQQWVARAVLQAAAFRFEGGQALLRYDLP